MFVSIDSHAAFAEVRAPRADQPSTGVSAMSCGKDQLLDCDLDMDAACRFLRRACPHGTAAFAASVTGATVSAAEKWLRGETRFSGPALAALIAFFGPAFLAAAVPGADWAKEQARHDAIGRKLDELRDVLGTG